jgi:hypothetical protein
MEKEWEPSVTALEVHVPPRGGLSTAEFASEAQKHRRQSRWKAGRATMTPTRRREQRALWNVCATRGEAEAGGGNDDRRWNPKTPVNSLVRCVSCNCCWRSVDLDPKNWNETPCQKLQETRWKEEEMIKNSRCNDPRKSASHICAITPKRLVNLKLP